MQEAECLEGLGKSTLSRETESILFGASVFAFITNLVLQYIFFSLVYQITQETDLTKILLVTFKHLCFFPIIYILEKWDYILKDYEINGCVCLSLKLNCINFCLD